RVLERACVQVCSGPQVAHAANGGTSPHSSSEPDVQIGPAGESHRVRWLVRLIVLALAVAAVREMRHRQQKVVAIGEDLNDQRQGIEAAESELDATDRSLDDAGSLVR